ncbi:hypothetical protein G5V57_00075 [Nordella sp. HKS 07]|uniref:hypothetical protein n=1 Tax=Nordella sp. HKS 07 TaxID=2712222 RepID=UPI0013E1EB47|nr:hypothetical protein [Nordella sp. HKS 07]QIG46296.1 hypothetical protein G5V57_00075 [Nordella sp. HKS 07]
MTSSEIVFLSAAFLLGIILPPRSRLWVVPLMSLPLTSFLIYHYRMIGDGHFWSRFIVDLIFLGEAYGFGRLINVTKMKLFD